MKLLYVFGHLKQKKVLDIALFMNKSKAIDIYEKYLTDVITPKIPVGATVIVHGHTDAIGEELTIRIIFLARANDVKNIIESALSQSGRKDVKFELNGFGRKKTISF
jgi:outer membrane protein OmpA-like peptidoglycan-associated protein